MKIRSVGTELSRAGGRMEGQTDVKMPRTISRACLKPARKAKTHKMKSSSPSPLFHLL